MWGLRCQPDDFPVYLHEVSMVHTFIGEGFETKKNVSASHFAIHKTFKKLKMMNEMLHRGSFIVFFN